MATAHLTTEQAARISHEADERDADAVTIDNNFRSRYIVVTFHRNDGSSIDSLEITQDGEVELSRV